MLWSLYLTPPVTYTTCFWPTWHLHAPIRVTPHATPNHIGPRTITLPHIPPNPPTLNYTATADMVPTNTQTTRCYTHITRYVHWSQINSDMVPTNTQTTRCYSHITRYVHWSQINSDMAPTNTQTTRCYSHITRYVHWSQINSSLHFTFSLCCWLTPYVVLYSLFSWQWA